MWDCWSPKGSQQLHLLPHLPKHPTGIFFISLHSSVSFSCSYPSCHRITPLGYLSREKQTQMWRVLVILLIRDTKEILNTRQNSTKNNNKNKTNKNILQNLLLKNHRKKKKTAKTFPIYSNKSFISSISPLARKCSRRKAQILTEVS